MTDELDHNGQHARLQAQWRKAAAKARAKRAAREQKPRKVSTDPLVLAGWRRTPSGDWVPRR